MKHGLPRKLRRAFILQVVAATFAIVIGTFLAGTIAKETIVSERLETEAASFWAGRLRTPDFPAPRSTAVNGVFVPAGQQPQRLPRGVADQAVGLHELPHGDGRLLIEDRPEGRLYLVMRFPMIEGITLWTSALCALLALLAVFITSWFTYRTAARLVGPVNQLARDVAQWDPRAEDGDAFALHRSLEHDTEVRQLGGALDDLAQRMRAYVQREREFTRDTSHELRTPLTVIRVATDMMLSDTDTSDRARRALMRMQRAGRDMETVVEAFLILARAGDVEPVAEAFDVHEAIDDEVEKARFAINGRPVELVVTVNGAPTLHASPKVLALMFGNLLENACTFTESGRIDVIVDNDRLVVRDTGIGMAPAVLQKVYEPFYRADPFNLTGKGMGLSVVRRLGERFGWPVTLESTPGHGTTATIGFPQSREASG